MEQLYKVDLVEGKNMGCIAMKDVKKGTLILQEKPQCYAEMILPKNSKPSLEVVVVIMMKP